MKQSIIGILAGMGPRSTSPFLEMILDQCQIQYGAKYDIDYPQIMIFSLPTPFYVDRQIDHTFMKSTIIEGLRKLESTGVKFIAMPCNSAHVYFKELDNSVNIPLLNIVDETINCLSDKSKRITIFATETTFKSEVYQKGIISAGHEFVFQGQWQENVNSIIQMIKMKESMQKIIILWKELVAEVINERIDTLIIACTDLSILKEFNEHGFIMLDSSESLARAVVRCYLKDMNV